MTLLALLRHGETPWSRERRIQGRTDVPLSDAARTELANCRVADEFGSMHAVTSPLKRCVETAHLLGLKSADVEPRIVEMSWGRWEGRTLAGLRQEFGDAMVANEAAGLDFTPPCGESPRQVLLRVREWLAEVAASDVGTIAVSHRGVIRVVFAAASGWDMLGRPPAKLDWAALHVFRLDPMGSPSVERLNVPLVPACPGSAKA